MNAHEQGYISSFVAEHRRGRWRQLLSSPSDPKYRRKLIQTCLGGMDFNSRCVVPGSLKSAGTDAVLLALRALGALDECYVISEVRELDGQYRALVAAVEQVLGNRFRTIVSCAPGKLAFFEGEVPSERRIFYRE